MINSLSALLLMLPIATQQRCVTPFHEALFTSTSALCVTGLVVQDTGSYWSAFGQSVILLLIQIGGLGVITVGAAFALLSGRKISLKQRSTMQEATAAPQMGGIVRLTGFILRITALFELVGAALLLPTFCADYGLRGIWYALFHSISAFCNAGFDLLGTEGAKFVSLTRYAGNPLLTTVIAALIVFGGLGFLTWEDICTYRLDFHRYRMQSKVILVTTAFLLVLPTLYFYCFEFTAGSARQRILLSMFQSVTPRTAGFNTADLAAMGSTSQALMVVLMLLGGSPGSTAGGTLNSKQKIRLEAYIQMNYLDRILVHANTRLMQMTAGQYELERIGAENQRSQSGLDLGVIDHYNGTRRSVKTLSGGESFKASLALALGLSDEVQSAAGGIRLDTLFLDEGFGSLDEESLEQAIRVLSGLTEGDRLVGIISHVAALKDRIDRQGWLLREKRCGRAAMRRFCFKRF